MELAALLVTEKTIKVKDVEIKIKTLELENLPMLFEIMGNIWRKFSGIKNEMNKRKGPKDPPHELSIPEMIAVVMSEPEALSKIIESTTNIPKNMIGKLNLAATTEILEAVIAENSDFLSKEVLPKVKALVEKVMDGQDKSNN